MNRSVRQRLFRGGIHPFDGKGLTKDKAIVSLAPGKTLIFPLSQHIGAPCLPQVEKGQNVLRGQIIASPSPGSLGANIHSSVSGVVKDIAPRPIIGGRSMAIVIESDGQAREVSFVRPDNILSFTREDALAAVAAAGIVGLGGACFPTSVKLDAPPDPEPAVDTVILNGAECEPYLTCDDRIMREYAEDITRGAALMRRFFPDARLVLGLEANKPEAIEAMRAAAVETGADLEIRVLPVMYPQGSEKQLIYAITGRSVPSGQLPRSVGCLVQNVATVRHIFLALIRGRPLMDRVLTVTGEAVANPGNFRVPLGTLVSDLLEAVGGFAEQPGKIIAGGPMMGVALGRTDVPIVKGTSGILAQTVPMTLGAPEQPCIRCGRCVEVCPMGLSAYRLNRLAVLEDYDGFIEEGGLDCIECGSCSYTCPSCRHIMQCMREAKRTAAARRKAHKE